MHPKSCMLMAAASLLMVASATVYAAAGDPPAPGLDLGAAKPKSEAAQTTSPGGLIPFGPSQKQKSAVDAGVTGNTGVGTAIKSPIGMKSVLGGPVTGSNAAQPANDTASSNDVVVKMPSNMKK